MSIEKATKDYTEAHAARTEAYMHEIRMGTEENADMRKMMAEVRIDRAIVDRHRAASAALADARAALDARAVETGERIAAAHEAAQAHNTARLGRLEKKA